MARGPALAPARPNSGRRLPGLAPARILVVAGGVGLLLLLAYLAARETSLFAVRSLEVRGASGAVKRAIEEAAAFVEGDSLVSLDGAELVRRLEALPFIVSVGYDRAFPNTLRISAKPERPVAVVRAGRSAWLVSERARVMSALPVTGLLKLPRVWLSSDNVLRPGETLGSDQQAAAVFALARLPENFPVQVAFARLTNGELVFTLPDHTELRLGGMEGLGPKLRAAAGVLEAIPEEERETISYLDLAVPERITAG